MNKMQGTLSWPIRQLVQIVDDRWASPNAVNQQSSFPTPFNKTVNGVSAQLKFKGHLQTQSLYSLQQQLFEKWISRHS